MKRVTRSRCILTSEHGPQSSSGAIAEDGYGRLEGSLSAAQHSPSPNTNTNTNTTSLLLRISRRISRIMSEESLPPGTAHWQLCRSSPSLIISHFGSLPRHHWRQWPLSLGPAYFCASHLIYSKFTFSDCPPSKEVNPTTVSICNPPLTCRSSLMQISQSPGESHPHL